MRFHEKRIFSWNVKCKEMFVCFCTVKGQKQLQIGSSKKYCKNGGWLSSISNIGWRILAMLVVWLKQWQYCSTTWVQIEISNIKTAVGWITMNIWWKIGDPLTGPLATMRLTFVLLNEMSPQLLDRFLWHLVQSCMFSTGWIVITLVTDFSSRTIIRPKFQLAQYFVLNKN